MFRRLCLKHGLPVTLYVVPTVRPVTQTYSLAPLPPTLEEAIAAPVAAAFQTSMAASNVVGEHTLIFAT
jgi:hypothetical protein